MPVFSVVVPSYGNVEYISQCLDSLIAQSFTDWEAIIVDDCSCDGSLALVGSYAEKDSRIISVAKSRNEGPHCARKTGVEKASGDYIVFIDPDDSFDQDALRLLKGALDSGNMDVLHYGINVSACGVPDDMRLSFESYVNNPCPELCDSEILGYAFDAELGYLQDWRVTQRVYAADLAKGAFSQMADCRLDRAEDSYEYFVLASFASCQITRNDIRALNYNYGRGVTGASSLSVAEFLNDARSFKKCIDAIGQYALSGGEPSLMMAKMAAGAESKLMDLLFNDWSLRLSSEDRSRSLDELVRIFNGIDVSVQVMRCVRDEAYRLLAVGENGSDISELKKLFSFAESIFVPTKLGQRAPVSDGVSAYSEYRDAAQSHLNDLEGMSLRSKWSAQPIKIFASAHKPVDLFDCDAIQPVQVGCALGNDRFPWAWHDDDGDNISDQNPMYCELTAQYWAWKNIDADYYGFCHYRRYFNFSPNRYGENSWGEIMEPFIDTSSQVKYGLDDGAIKRAIDGYDVVTTEVKDLRDFPGDANTPLMQYEAAAKLNIDDLYHVFAILEDMHPDYAEDINAFANGNQSCFCNMFLMKKELFFGYCEWLFPILERFVEEWDSSLCSKEGLRTPGHLAERLLNIYLMHGERVGAGWKRKQVQCVHIEYPDKRYYDLPPVPGYAECDKPIVPVVFAADNNYAPMVTTTIASMLANASKDYFYDVVVIEDGITGSNKEQMVQFVAQYGNASIRFFGAGAMIADYELTTSNEHISKETYYRFLIQDILPYYGKVVYLDSDLVVEGDVSELFELDLEDSLLAAAHDVDYLGNLNMHDGERMEYTKEILGMKRPFDYFQAGVLVLNVAEMRKLHSVKEWLEIASNPDYIYNDQDILNAHCQGRVKYLGYEWNVMHDCGGRVGNVFSFAPASAFDSYNASRSNPKIIHYAGFEKPWIMPECDFAEHYWKYARSTPFYEKLIALISKHKATELHLLLEEEARPPKVVGENSRIRKVIDPIMPLGSRRREVAKAVGRKLRGRS